MARMLYSQGAGCHSRSIMVLVSPVGRTLADLGPSGYPQPSSRGIATLGHSNCANRMWQVAKLPQIGHDTSIVKFITLWHCGKRPSSTLTD